ncbi:MAG: sugar ABC transporter substrate-binding protein [Clostridia bacterium]
MRKLVALLLVALLVLGFTASAQEPNTDITVGFCPMDLSNNFFAAIANSMQAYADEKGVTAIIKDGKSDAATQVTALENFIAQGVDVIVVVPVDAESLKGVIAEAKASGIPVITHTTHYDDATVNLNLSEIDMGYANGSNCGKWMAETFGADADCKYAILTQRSLEQTIGRENGIMQGIVEYVPNAQCVMTVDANTTDMGITAAEDILNAHPEVVAILGINDSGALGAYETCVAQEVGSQFYIGGNDGTDQALKLIKDGTIYRGSVDINPKGTGVQMIDYAIDLCNSVEVPADYDIPVYAISIENVDSYLE